MCQEFKRFANPEGKNEVHHSQPGFARLIFQCPNGPVEVLDARGMSNGQFKALMQKAVACKANVCKDG
jgi:hypothetical protein